LKAKNIFDVLTGSTVSVLNELESILVKDIVLLTSVLPKEFSIPTDLQGEGDFQRKPLSERNLARIQENIKKHIYGEKMNVVFDAFDKAIGNSSDGSDSVFHLLPSSMLVIKSLIEKQSQAEKKLLSLSECISEVEQQKSQLRRSGRERTTVIYKDVSAKDAKISEKEFQIQELELERVELINELKERQKQIKLPTKQVETKIASKEKEIVQKKMEIAEIEQNKVAEVLTPFQMVSGMVKPLVGTVGQQFASINKQFETFRDRLPDLSNIVRTAASLFPGLTGGGRNHRRVYHKKRTTLKKRVQFKTKKIMQKLHKKTKLIKKNKKYTHKK
jgi:chromosome segregation ATPase